MSTEFVMSNKKWQKNVQAITRCEFTVKFKGLEHSSLCEI